MYALQTILHFCIPNKDLTKTHSHKFIYIFPKTFMIFRQELLVAAVRLWTNLIPKGCMITNMMPVPIGSNLGSQRCQCENITKFARWIRTWRLVGLYFYFFNFICGIWNWGMASSFWNHVIQTSIRQVQFQDIYSQMWIVKTLVKTFTFSLLQILTSEEQLCMFNMDF